MNFCLNDGEYLKLVGDDAPPTVLLDPPRVTNQTNWQQYQGPAAPPAPWNNQPQNVQNQSFGTQNLSQSKDQTLPTVSLVLGILSLLLVCCFGGFPLGLAAVITGYLGMKNADQNPTRYGGRSLAIGGIVLGVISILSSVVYIILSVFAN